MIAALAALALAAAPPPWARFADPQPVAIEGYAGEAMEPFVSRDGRLLFFNSRNGPKDQTDLYWAERIDDLHFRYRGPVAGANSAALDGVATLSRGGRFCFISPRAYAATLATVHCGDWRGDRVAGVALQAAASPHIPGRVVFDMEIAADGASLVLSDGIFDGGPAPRTADLRLARAAPGGFRLAPADDRLFAAVNTPALEYAAGLSADGLTLAFTRMEGRPPFARLGLWIARRPTPGAPFAALVRIAAIKGFVEAPSFAADGALYFHRGEAGHFTLWRAAPATATTGGGPRRP